MSGFTLPPLPDIDVSGIKAVDLSSDEVVGYSAAAMLAYALKVRELTLEEAARLCESEKHGWDIGYVAAEAIRKLLKE